jgi:predicted dehydrogenase
MSPLSRREFLGTAARAGAGFWVAGRQLSFGQEKSPNARLNIGFVGVGGMRGKDHLGACAGETVAALCDVDDRTLAHAAAQYPKAASYNDFRLMLEKEKGLDAVVLSIPDHVHVPAAVMAMRLGKHVYCEKPLAHSVYEARVAAETALKTKVATQMGTQIHAENNYRRVVELVQSGAIGGVREVQVFVGGHIWTASSLPGDDVPCPAHVHWDLWLGPAAERPYSRQYHPTNWRSFWNFGGGHLGDMGCHHIDLAFWALKLRHPRTIQARGPEVNPDGAPPWLEVTWEFDARGEMPPVRLVWTHGEKKPAIFQERKLPEWGNGTLFVGEKGMLLADYGKHKLLPEDDFRDFRRPEPTIPNSIGHHAEWIRGAKTGEPTLCNFDYSGALTETVLLGNVAYRTGQKIEWDAAALKARNCPQANAFLRREYRKGWTL